jgi:hypothetical protein
MVSRTSLGAMHRHLNNNTPVNTEVLWGVVVVTPGFSHGQDIVASEILFWHTAAQERA